MRREKLSFAQPLALARFMRLNFMLCARDLRGKGSAGRDSSVLPAGLYHFGAAEFGLRQLRAGDFRQTLVEATWPRLRRARAPSSSSAPGLTGAMRGNITRAPTGISAGIMARSSRIVLAIAAASNLPAEVVAGFIDSQVNALLGLDTNREVAFSHRSTRTQRARAARSPPSITFLSNCRPLRIQKRKSTIRRCARCMKRRRLNRGEDLNAWRGPTPANPAPPAKGDVTVLQPFDDSEVPQDSIEQVISRRGSTRQFSRDPLTLAATFDDARSRHARNSRRFSRSGRKPSQRFVPDREQRRRPARGSLFLSTGKKNRSNC